MLFRNMNRKYYEEMQEGGEGASGATPAGKTYTQADLDAEVARLKAKNAELLGEKKSAVLRLAEEENARIKFEQESAKASNKLEDFEKSLRSEFAKEKDSLSGKLTALQTRVIGAERKAVLSNYASDFLTAESLDIISPLIHAEFDGENVTTQFKDFTGKVITTDPAEFKTWMANHPAISQLMKADGATGGGATGSKNGGGAASKMSRSNFDNLNPSAKKAFMSSGGTLTD